MYLKTLTKRGFSQRFQRLSYTYGQGTLPLICEHTSQRLRTTVEKYHENLALIDHQQKIQYTYEQLNEEVDKIAKGLVALGLQKGDRVGIYSPNRSEWTIVQFAAARAGLILVNVNPAFQTNELTYCLNKVGVKTLIMAEKFKSSNYVKIVQDMVPELNTSLNPLDLGNIKNSPSLKNVVLFGNTNIKGMINFKDLESIWTSTDALELQKRENSIYFEDNANIQFTSGTTGFPKGATLNHYNIINNALFTGQYMKMTSNDRYVINVPLYHCMGMVVGNLVCVNFGSTMVYPGEGFDPVHSLEAITEHKGTALIGVPTMFISMLQEYHKNKGKYDVSSLRTGFIGGSVCPEPLMNSIINDFNMKEFTIGYGQTEASPILTMTEANDPIPKKVNTIGKAAPLTEIKIINPTTGDILPWGETGEICARGYQVMPGYWDDDKKTKETIDEKGWLKTGDLGLLDEDSYVRIIGRSKDMIIRGGENIYPKELEEFFMTFPNVSDVQVIGINDEYMGEEVCAWIKLKESEKTTIEDLIKFSQGKIAHYKVPRYVRFVSEYPMTVNGKIKKNDMRHITTELLKHPGHDILDTKKHHHHSKK